MRKTKFENGEYYHIYNRCIDKNILARDRADIKRFFQSLNEFNVKRPIGSLYEKFYYQDKFGNQVSKKDKLVEFICYCVNPNHYHFLLKQNTEGGISRFMHKAVLGYTKYYNQRYGRSGALFQSPFKAINVNSNEYLLHLSVYINLNYRVHKIDKTRAFSSWNQYANQKIIGNIKCKKDIVLKQFRNDVEYREFAENSLEAIWDKKDMAKILLE
ncbi:MAG: transposase [Parcubacteria group bacterium]|jgi:putative transposase